MNGAAPLNVAPPEYVTSRVRAIRDADGALAGVAILASHKDAAAYAAESLRQVGIEIGDWKVLSESALRHLVPASWHPAGSLVAAVVSVEMAPCGECDCASPVEYLATHGGVCPCCFEGSDARERHEHARFGLRRDQ